VSLEELGHRRWCRILVKAVEVQTDVVTSRTNAVCNSECKYYGLLLFFHRSQIITKKKTKTKTKQIKTKNHHHHQQKPVIVMLDF